MAWSIGSDVTAGSVLTASRYNQDVIANLTAIGGAWTAYTPTFTNLTLGNGTQVFRYMNAGKLYVVRFKITWGSTTSISGQPEWTLPDAVSANAGYNTGVSAFGTGFLQKFGGSAWMALITSSSGTLARARYAVFTVSGSNITFGGLSSTSPTTWATNDVFEGQFMFEAA